MQAKKLVLDLRWVRNTNLEGISRYSIEIAKSLASENDKNNKPFELVLLFDSPKIADFVLEKTGNTQQSEIFPVPVLDLREPFLLPNFLAKLGTNVFLGMNYLTFPFNKNFRTALVVHDLVQYAFPASNESNLRWKLFFKFKTQVKFILKKADLIFADSISTKEDLKQIFSTPEEKIKVIYPGMDSRFLTNARSEEKRAVKKKYALPERFILNVSRQEPRKNLSTLIRAYHDLPGKIKKDFPLVLAGKKSERFFPELEDLIKELREDKIIFPGYIEENDLSVLYQSSSLVVYPSLYEGFGFPVVEAMASRVPVISSNVSSLPEVAGKETILIDPDKSANITKAIEAALVKKDLNLENSYQKAATFTWERTSSQIFQNLLNLAKQ